MDVGALECNVGSASHLGNSLRGLQADSSEEGGGELSGSQPPTECDGLWVWLAANEGQETVVAGIEGSRD